MTDTGTMERPQAAPTEAKMQKLFNWRAQRAGGRITIYAKDVNSSAVRITGVDEIASGDPHPVATDKDGNRYQLV